MWVNVEAAAQLCENVLGRTKENTHTKKNSNLVSKKKSDFFSAYIPG